ncbi:MAG: metallophosphoesterase [Phycisphaerae bacterium]|nr:metallophosphoesterase [Phycisphaerae bacterium]
MAAVLLACAAPCVGEGVATTGASGRFRLWASGCCHVGTDLRKSGRESLGEAIRQSEFGGSRGGPAFDWDIAVHLGDFSGDQGPPKDDEGLEVVRQFGALRKHRREHFYCLLGNHDSSVPGQPLQWWFRKYVDPTGEHTSVSGVDAKKRPYPVEGTWERYSFRVGNLLFLMMGDRNDGGPPVGRGERGGYPAGAVTGETFAWWKRMVEQNRDCVIISAHHHMLKETTVASGPWEGFRKDKNGKWKGHYHGYFPRGGPEGASYLYFVDGRPDAQAFERYLADHPGAIDIWLGGHTHTHPDDRTGGRSHIERKWGATFVNVCALSRHHASVTTVPMSRLLTFAEGSDEVRVQCYLHTSDYRPQGWYGAAERVIKVGKQFRGPG